MDGEVEEDEVAIDHLRLHIDSLSADVHRIYVSPSGELVSTYSDANDDPTYCVHYPGLAEANIPNGTQTVRRDELEELDRLGPDVDLVVFKYYFMWQYAEKSWREMNLWMRLPCHPNIVSFDRVVLDEIDNRLVGFTNDYIPGGTLEENSSRIFKSKWLQQLTQVVDFLNVECGIAHQDIAPRNLLVNEPTDSIMIFDFNFSARLDHTSRDPEEDLREDRNDLKGVMFTVYELITGDDTLRSVPYDAQRLEDLGGEWKQHPEVQLDRPLEEYRALLSQWTEKRKTTAETAKAITWPSRPEPTPEIIHDITVRGDPFSYTTDGWIKMRKELQRDGKEVLNWERPPQRQLSSNKRLLSTGKFIEETSHKDHD